MPLKEDYVHDAVMHIRQAIAHFQNPNTRFSLGYNKEINYEIHCAIDSCKNARAYHVIDLLKEVKYVDHIPVLNVCIDVLHMFIHYNQPQENPNQLTINFNGEQNPDNQN